MELTHHNLRAELLVALSQPTLEQQLAAVDATLQAFRRPARPIGRPRANSLPSGPSEPALESRWVLLHREYSSVREPEWTFARWMTYPKKDSPRAFAKKQLTSMLRANGRPSMEFLLVQIVVPKDLPPNGMLPQDFAPGGYHSRLKADAFSAKTVLATEVVTP